MAAPVRIVIAAVSLFAFSCLVCAQEHQNDKDPSTKDQKIEELTRRAENGDTNAQFRLGFLYDRGANVDFAKALHWYTKAADRGDHAAQNNLAAMYANGRGIPKDEARAAMWYLRAASEGYAPAQNNVGFMYANGLGLPHDDNAATRWYGRAAAAHDH